jgi:hypothetical protein
MDRKILFAFIAGAGLATILAVSGCAWGRPDPDPLTGWKEMGSAHSEPFFAKAIADDYAEYVRKLSARERKFVDDYNTWFYEDATGRHAIRLALAHDGSFWDHILIYGPDNRRVRTIKRFGGHYRS